MERTILTMQVLQLPSEPPSFEIIVIEFVPRGQRCYFGARRWGKRAEIETIDATGEDINGTREKSPYDEPVYMV